MLAESQQKCIVARGIATNPKVLILDEPTKGIDVGAKSEFYNMICQFAKTGAWRDPDFIGTSGGYRTFRQDHCYEIFEDFR